MLQSKRSQVFSSNTIWPTDIWPTHCLVNSDKILLIGQQTFGRHSVWQTQQRRRHLASRHLADRHLADRHLAERHLAKIAMTPSFGQQTFCLHTGQISHEFFIWPTDIWPTQYLVNSVATLLFGHETFHISPKHCLVNSAITLSFCR
jgi:hypothetical protein